MTLNIMQHMLVVTVTAKKKTRNLMIAFNVVNSLQ